MMSGFQKGQTHFCSLSRSIENHENADFFVSPNFVENVQPGLAYICQPSSHIFWKSAPNNPHDVRFPKTYFCSLSGCIENIRNADFSPKFCRKRSAWSCRYISAF